MNYVLGAGSLDVGTLCQHKNINKNARHKPLRFPYVNVRSLSDDYVIEKTKYANGEDYYGNIGGLQSASYKASASNLANLGQGMMFAYIYPGYGGNKDWFRLVDFDGYWHNYNYIFSGSVPFFATVTTESPKLGGSVTLALTLGAYEKSDDQAHILSGEELAQLSSKYFGVMFIRSNGNTNNNSQQYGGNDYLICTTDKRVKQYSSGLTSILGGLCEVYKADEYHYTFTFKIPSNSLGLLATTSANFDNFVNKTIKVVPIMANSIIEFWDSGSTTTDVWPLAFDKEHFSPLEFTLQPANYNPLYKKPNLTLTFTSSKSGTNYIFNQFTLTFKNNSSTGRYFVRIVNISFTIEYQNGTVWTLDGNASMNWHSISEGVYIDAGQTGTYTRTDGITYMPVHSSAKLRVTPSVFVEITDETGAKHTEYYNDIATKTMN